MIIDTAIKFNDRSVKIQDSCTLKLKDICSSFIVMVKSRKVGHMLLKIRMQHIGLFVILLLCSDKVVVAEKSHCSSFITLHSNSSKPNVLQNDAAITIVKMPIKGRHTVTNVTLYENKSSKLELVAGAIEYVDSDGLNKIPSLHVFKENDSGQLVQSNEIILNQTSVPVPPYHFFETLRLINFRQNSEFSPILASIATDLYFIGREDSTALQKPVLLLKDSMQAITGTFFQEESDKIGILAYSDKEKSLFYSVLSRKGEINGWKKIIELTDGPVFDGLIVQDMNNDSKNDVLIRSKNILILKNTGKSFEVVDTGISGNTNGTIAVGANSNGIIDLVVTDATELIDMPGKVHVYSRKSSDSLTHWSEKFVGSANDNHPQSSMLFDINKDGLLDLILPGFDSGNVYYYPAKPDGGYGPLSTIDISTRTNGGTVSYIRGLKTRNGSSVLVGTAGSGIFIYR